MSYQSWMAREVDLLLNGDKADEERGDAEILKDLKHFVHCSQELSKRDPTTREKIYLSYLRILYSHAGFAGEFEFHKLEDKLLDLMEPKPPKCSHKYDPDGYGYGFRNFKCRKCGKTKTERTECPE